jgi:Holliday junction DNA helicase RuvB
VNAATYTDWLDLYVQNDPLPELLMAPVDKVVATEDSVAVTPVAVTTNGNELRPVNFDSVVGQVRTKALLHRITEAALSRQRPLDHVLLVGPSGTGKTTLAVVIANAMKAAVYQTEAPISHETLMALRETMEDGDILFIDEIHQQAIMERRGRQTSTQPEVLFSVMEDRSIITPTGVLPFPEITVVGATTDEGMLPDAFINRFPLRPVIEPYTEEDLTAIARMNARTLRVSLSDDAARLFARACRGVPRQVNNYIRNGVSLIPHHGDLDLPVAKEVVSDLNQTTFDGLTLDQQNVLKFLYQRCRRITRATGDVTYQASVATIATAIGKSRDTKAIQLRVEPYLIERGYLQVGHGGRLLTEAGMERAKGLLHE